MAYQLTQTGAEVQESLNTVPENEERIDALETDVSSLQSGKADKATTLSGYNIGDAYTKEQVNNMVTTPDQQYVSVTATDQTTDVTEVLPSEGAANTIYRVGNWDGSQYDDTVYSEYAWNGTQYVHISTKNPGIDDVPTVNSGNLVTSSGVKVDGTPDYFIYPNLFLTVSGGVSTSVYDTFCITDYLPITRTEDIVVRGWCSIGLVDDGVTTPIHFYDADKHFLAAYTGNYRSDFTYTVAKDDIPANAVLVRFTGNKSRTHWWDASLVIKGVDLASAAHYERDVYDNYPKSWSGNFFYIYDHVIRTYGGREPNEGFACTPYIPITGNADIYVKGAWQYGTICPMAYYDTERNFVSAATGTQTTSYNVDIHVTADNIPATAKYIRCTCNTAQDVEHTIIGTDMAALLKHMDENDSSLQADIDNVENLLVKKVPQTPTVISGSWFNTDGTVGPAASISIYKYTIEEGEEYILDAYQPSGYGVPILGFMDNDNQIFEAQKKFDESGSSETTVSDYTINIPDNAVYIVVNVINAQASRTSVCEKQYVNVSELEQKVESVAMSKLCKVTVSATSAIVRTHFDSTRDIITDYSVTDNGNYTWNNSYLGGRNESDDAIMQNTVHVMGDSTAAIYNGSKAPWHMWVQHGYCIPVITTSSSLSSDDIGSVWMDASSRKYTIGNISGTTVYLLPEIKDSSVSGVKTRSWEVPADNPVTTPLTWVSGGVTTSDITVESSSYTQIRPFMELVKRDLIADGKKVTEYGSYECDEFVISETFKCLDPWTTTFLPTFSAGDAGAYFTETFTITGMTCRYDTVLNMQKPYFFGFYGIICVQHLAVRSDFPSYDKVWALMPRVKKEYNGSALSVPFDVTDLTRPGENVVRSTSNLYDVDKQPDRFLTWLENSGTNEMLIGVACGYSLVRGLTKDSERNNLIRTYQSGDFGSISINPSLRNKCYLKCVVDSHFADGVLPSSFIGQFSTYMSYFDPNANTGQVYWYKDGNDYIIYAHYQEAHDKVAINLPFVMEGRTVEVVDSTEDMSVICGTVNDGKIFVSVPAGDHNYIVLKTK